MPLTTSARLDQLKGILQDISSAEFEKLTAALLSTLLGVGVAIAKSGGYQFGGDGGPSGRQDRRFRIECKKYSDNTNFSDRELLGEVDQALASDPALEAWVLSATRAASEQLEKHFQAHADLLGLPIIVIDWKPNVFPALAALCTSAPDVVETLAGTIAADLVRELTPDGQAALKSLTLDLEAWSLGFKHLRDISQKRLQTLWSTPRESRAKLGQDVAGGHHKGTIRRKASFEGLSSW